MKVAAEKYLKAGLSILPVKQDKSPAVKKWKDVKFSPDDFIGAEGIGAMCGKVSLGLECQDFDNHFYDAKKTLSDWMMIEEVKTILQKYKLPINSTQTGGYHVLYRCEIIEGNQKLAKRAMKSKVTGRTKPDAIIETRGEGGYFLVPPTKGYKQIRNSMLDIPVISEEEREILITASKSFNEWEDEWQGNSPVHRNSSERVGDIYNDDSESIYEAKNALKTAGWTDIGNKRWRRPDKDKGVSATFGVIADNVFYPFSSNSYPFEERRAYTPFQIVCLLNYGGDFKAFAKVLGERYNPTGYSDVGVAVYDQSKQPQITNKEKQKRELSRLDDILTKAYIDTSIVVPKPPTVLEIRADYGREWQRVCSLGNFSCITGKAKAKKTFFTSMVNAAVVGNRPIYDRIRGVLPESKSGVLRFDTEQANYDAYLTTVRAEKMAGTNTEHFGTFDLREYSPMERCEIIEHALNVYRNEVGFVIIDGIADLAFAINDEKEATRVTTLLLQWTKNYNMHIMVVIHQNKGDSFATGHLGSSIMKKAEAIIAVEAMEENRRASIVKHSLQRGAPEFDDFNFFIDDNGVPVVIRDTGILDSSAADIYKTI